MGNDVPRSLSQDSVDIQLFNSFIGTGRLASVRKYGYALKGHSPKEVNRIDTSNGKTLASTQCCINSPSL